jgi:hypothetical protein
LFHNDEAGDTGLFYLAVEPQLRTTNELATLSTRDCCPIKGARVTNSPSSQLLSLASGRYNMQPILESYCGIDVHKSMIKASIAKGPLDKPPKKTTRTFSTMTSDLLKLKDWLRDNEV